MINTKLLNILILFFILSSLIFKFYPQVDIVISSLFYNDGFYLKGSFYEQFFYYSIRPIIASVVIGSLGVFFYNYFSKKNIFLLGKRKLLYIILVISLTPGIIVEYGFKQNFERPRPKEIELFGGKKEFYPAYTFAKQNSKSFISGHSAAAFSLVGIALLFYKRKRLFILLSLGYGLGMIIARIMAGGHFFSDVLLSALLVLIANILLYKAICNQDILSKKRT